MSYSKESRDLSQNQVIENLRAIVNSDYFKAYNLLSGSRINSDMVRVESIGGWKEGFMDQFKVGDLTDVIIALLNTIESKGNFHEAYIQLSPFEERLRAMNFEERLYEEDDGPSLPISFSVSKQGRQDPHYVFRVCNLGFKESYFESNGLDLKDAKKKLGIWYSEVTRNLKKILPHPVQNSR